MKIKSNIFCGIIGAASLLTSPSLFASIIGTGSLTINAPGYNATGDQAGPYLVSSLTPLTGPNPGSSFETFCIGTQVDYSPGSSYNYQISGTVQPTAGVGSPGFITWGTAFLYSEYRAGLIGDGAKNDPINDAVQGAIWALQNQNTAGITFSPDAGYEAALLTAAQTAAGLAGVSDLSNANGAFGVYALNMLSGGTYAQPQLCIVPEPTTFLAGGLMLLPFVAGGLRIARKRLA